MVNPRGCGPTGSRTWQRGWAKVRGSSAELQFQMVQVWGLRGAAAEKAEGKPGEDPAPKKATGATHGKGRTYAAQVDRGPWERLLLSNEHPGCWLG